MRKKNMKPPVIFLFTDQHEDSHSPTRHTFSFCNSIKDYTETLFLLINGE